MIVAHFYYYLTLFFCCDVMSVRNFNFFSVSPNEPRIRSETSSVMWHVAPESKIQMVNFELSPKFPLGLLSLLDMRAIDAYIFWSLLFSLLLCAQLPCLLKRTCFRQFLFSFGGFGHLAIRWYSDPNLKYFRDVRSVRLLSEESAARAFYFSCLIILKHFSAEWLVPPQKVHFVCYFSQNLIYYQDLDNQSVGIRCSKIFYL